MAAREANGDTHVNIEAVYKSPTGSSTLQQSVSPMGSAETTSKASYLKSIRAATKALQGDINGFLTNKMEEDKQAATPAGTTTNGVGKGKSHDDVEEEENYGEEKIEDD